MIALIALSAWLHASAALAVCTTLDDCPQFAHLQTDGCQPYHHFLARGSTSPYPGHVIETVAKVCNALNTQEQPGACGYEDVEYWAMNGGEKWCISSHEGAVRGAEQMRNYTARCPDSHLILMGFSQGGSVLLDVLGGGGGELWGCNQQENVAMDVASAPGSKVLAAIAFGPTRRSAHQSFTHGGCNVSDGGAPRTAEQNAGLLAYADAGVLREYCHPGDPICCPKSDNKHMSKHLDYFDQYGDEAAAWVIGLAKKAAQKDRTAGARAILHQTISHPVANALVLLFVLFLLYFVVRKVAVWKTTRFPPYAPVSTTAV